MPRKNSEEAVNSAMERLRNMYRTGQKAAARKVSRKETYGKKNAQQLAEELGISGSDVYTAEQFAERYTENELEELMSKCRSAGFPMGKTHIARLITVRDKLKRRRLQEKCIQEGWTDKMLQAHVTGEYGKRSSGGAKFHPPKSVDAAKSKIAELCSGLIGFHEAMKSADPDSDEECGLADLPEGLQKQLRRTMTQVEKLAAECGSGE